MKRPSESDYTSHVAYTRALEAYCDEKRERNFCERCGKRLFDGIHTCTPPAEQLKRKWVGLRWSDTPDKWVGNIAFMEGAKWAERTLKERNA